MVNKINISNISNPKNSKNSENNHYNDQNQITKMKMKMNETKNNDEVPEKGYACKICNIF